MAQRKNPVVLPIAILMASLGILLIAAAAIGQIGSSHNPEIGREVAIPHHLQDDDEFSLPITKLLDYGKKVFMANWTEEEGAGRPLTKGTGVALSDPAHPLTGQRAFNRISGPDANSCYGCHNEPYGVAGGSGDFATAVFVLGQRFDFLTFDPTDQIPMKGAVDEQKHSVTLQTAANFRKSTGMFGAGYLEMLARQMTAELQAERDTLKYGQSCDLVAKGISFGHLTRRKDGTWDTSHVEGLPRLSIISPTALAKPPLVIRPWHQAANVVSIREFSNTAFNQHHGMQSSERFGEASDPDGDGIKNELTRADLTAVSMFQAAIAVPGRVIPNDPEIEHAILNGEQLFEKIGCSSCHVSKLKIDKQGWIYSEPNPYNPVTNLRPGTTRTVSMDLNSPELPLPRLAPDPANPEVLWVPAYTDFKLHDICGPADPGEALDQNQTVWNARFHVGNRKFLTRRLWGVANEPPFFHNGAFTTLRKAVLNHYGEANPQRLNFEHLSRYDQDSLIEFLKSLQVLPPGTTALIVDENYKPKSWPPHPSPSTPSITAVTQSK